MINARSKRRPGFPGDPPPPPRPPPPGGCELSSATQAYISLGSFTRCYAASGSPYFGRAFIVNPPGLSRWGYVVLDTLPSGVITVPTVEVTAPIFPGFGGRALTADNSEIVVATYANAWRWFGAYGLAIQGDLQLRARVLASQELSDAYTSARLVLSGVNGRWVDVLATGWNAIDYSNPDPGDPAIDLGDLWSAEGENTTDCPTGYVVSLPGNPSTCPASFGPPGWIDEPDPALIVDQAVSSSPSLVWAV